MPNAKSSTNEPVSIGTLWRAARAIGENFSNHYSASEEQQRALFNEAVKLREGDWIVELGVCNGRTAAILSYAAKLFGASYIGIDHFGLENTASGIRALFEKYSLNGMIWDVNTHVAGASWTAPISLLFIDAGHDEYNVRKDIDLWVPCIKPGGVVAFHDWDDPFDRDSAHWAIRFYGEKAIEGWEQISCPIGMAMFRRPR